MERYWEIVDVLGEDNVIILLDDMRNGDITPEQLRDIALRMGKSVYGKYKQRRNENKPVDVNELRTILDDWWNLELYKMTEKRKAFATLLAILNHMFVALNSLAHRLVEPCFSCMPCERQGSYIEDGISPRMSPLHYDEERQLGSVFDRKLTIRKENPILCAKCNANVGDRKNIIRMFERPPPTKSFTNPHGYVHEVIPIKTARNIRLDSAEPTEYFTWFEGFAWTIAYCSKTLATDKMCGNHIGWKYTSTNGKEPFFGFTAANLKFADDLGFVEDSSTDDGYHTDSEEEKANNAYKLIKILFKMFLN